MVNNSEKGHIDWIDTAKGLGLILVIYGHLLYTGTWDVVNRAIYSFHMPMYFILSGWLIKPDTKSLRKYINDKAVRLLIPAFLFILLTLPIYIYSLKTNNFFIFGVLKDIFYIKGKVAYNAPVWFLICMFQISVIGKVIQIDKYKLYAKITAMSLCFVLAFVLYYYLPCPYLGIDKAILAFAFYITGSIMRETIVKLNRITLVCLFMLSTFLWVLFGIILNSKISMYGFSLGVYWYFIISGICGSITWFGISYLLRNKVIFKDWAMNTIFVLGTHYVGVSIVTKIANMADINDTIIFDITALIMTIAALFLYMPICKLVNKYIPIFNGRKKQKIESVNIAGKF